MACIYFYKQTTNLLTTCRAQQVRDLVHILCHIDAFESTFINSFMSSGVGTHYILVLKTPCKCTSQLQALHKLCSEFMTSLLFRCNDTALTYSIPSHTYTCMDDIKHVCIYVVTSINLFYVGPLH